MALTDKETIWIDYMVSQKLLIHFRPWINVIPQHKQFWYFIKYPILEIALGTYNHPKINIIPFEEFTDDMFLYWDEIMKNKNGLIKWNSHCKYSSQMEKMVNEMSIDEIITVI